MLPILWYKLGKCKDLELWRSGDSWLKSLKPNMEELFRVQNHNMLFLLGLNSAVDLSSVETLPVQTHFLSSI